MLSKLISAAAALLSLTLIGPAARAEGRTLLYETRALGMTAAVVELSYDLSGSSYQTTLRVRSAGMASMAGFDSSMTSFGQMTGSGLRPATYDYINSSRGDSDRLIANMPAGQFNWSPDKPIPPEETLAPGLIASSLDPTSALFDLILKASRQGRCDGSAQVFDGRSIIGVNTQTLGSDSPSGVGLPLVETALRCRMTGSPIAGKVLRPKDAAKLVPLDIWMAQPAGLDLRVPVKIEGKVRGVPVNLVLVGLR